MGLCKCPKKKVTNLFCFEHTVNVCEHCLVANHSRCVVQSYLQWLQDSDYDPTCRLCGKNLSDESCGPCVRLLCYDLFHWVCLDSFARSLPANTAPAGYTCPICHVGLFPPNNMVSPVVDSLKELLSKVNWARGGLGLPMVKEAEVSNAAKPAVNGSNPAVANSAQSASQKNPLQQNAVNSYSQSVIPVDETAAYSRIGDKSDLYSASQAYLAASPGETLLNVSQDHDRDKYKRRSAFQWFSRWFSSRTNTNARTRKDPNASIKRFIVIGFLIILAVMTLIIIFSRLGHAVTDDDPSLDPAANPNIRVESV